jgi:hypothetical protein
MSFLYHLELGGGEVLCHHLAPLSYGLVGGTLEPRGGAIPDYFIHIQINGYIYTYN